MTKTWLRWAGSALHKFLITKINQIFSSSVLNRRMKSRAGRSSHILRWRRMLPSSGRHQIRPELLGVDVTISNRLIRASGRPIVRMMTRIRMMMMDRSISGILGRIARRDGHWAIIHILLDWPAVKVLRLRSLLLLLLNRRCNNRFRMTPSSINWLKLITFRFGTIILESHIEG